jgi:heat shock protein HtpX
MGRAELFPRDWALTVQMVLVAVLTPLAVIALIVAALWLLPGPWQGALVVSLSIGLFIAAREWRGAAMDGRLGGSAYPELLALVDRLCVIADVSRPAVVVEHERQPNSWLIDLPFRQPRLHLTTGLLQLLDGDELAAVIAHELSHLANRDAAVMSVVGAPGMLTKRPTGLAVVVLLPIQWVSGAGTSALSRCRELAADRAACAITGRPSALASALIKVSDGIAGAPAEDLRKVAIRDSFHFVATSSRGGLVGIGRTHPPVERRLAALQQLEHHLQHARGGL